MDDRNQAIRNGRLHHPKEQADAQGIIDLLNKRRRSLERLLWMKAWANTHADEYKTFLGENRGTAEWWASGARLIDLMAKMARFHQARLASTKLPSLPTKEGRDADVALARLAIHFLRTGTYLGPGPCSLPEPAPHWQQDEADALAEQMRWGDVVRDLSRPLVKQPQEGMRLADLRVQQAANYYSDVLKPLFDDESALPPDEDTESSMFALTLAMSQVQSRADLLGRLVVDLCEREGRHKAVALGISDDVTRRLRAAHQTLAAFLDESSHTHPV